MFISDYLQIYQSDSSVISIGRSTSRSHICSGIFMATCGRRRRTHHPILAKQPFSLLWHPSLLYLSHILYRRLWLLSIGRSSVRVWGETILNAVDIDGGIFTRGVKHFDVVLYSEIVDRMAVEFIFSSEDFLRWFRGRSTTSCFLDR